MLKINQHMKNIDQNFINILKSDVFEIHLDTDIIKSDINRLKNELEEDNKINKTNIKALIKYLNTLVNSVDENGRIELCYNIKDNKIVTYPITLKSYPEYNINTADYILLHNEKMININITDIINIMAFEYIYRDFGYSIDDIEEVLCSAGIAGIVDIKDIKDFLNNEKLNAFMIGRGAKMEDCPYISSETRTIKNYLGTNKFKLSSLYYNDVLIDNAKTITSLIASEVHKVLNDKGIDARIVMIGETNLAIIVNEDSDIETSSLIENISIRFFGRNFKVDAQISVY